MIQCGSKLWGLSFLALLLAFISLSTCNNAFGPYNNSADPGSAAYVPHYTVSYNGNGATGGSVPVGSTGYTKGSTITVLGNTGNLVRSGYNFLGWNTQANGGGTAYAPGQTLSIGGSNIALYAQWTVNPVYAVTYSGNGATGGSVPIDANIYLQGQTVTVLGNTGNLVKTGCTFSGWNTQANGSGTAYTQGQTFAISSNVTLYALWPAITTVAGNGTGGYSGDGGAATSAELDYPAGVAVDSSGNIYIAETYNNRIRKVSTTGTITTVAGNGTAGYSGDGGAATSAELQNPRGVAVDSSGNIYIADTDNARIRKVSTAGTITTVAGDGAAGYSGDGGAATSAEFEYPYGVAVDSSGNIYIADTYNYRIRKVSTAGTISTVAGNGTGGYSGNGVAATSAELYYPRGVAVDSSGNIYIADTDNERIRKVSTAGTITTVAGNGTYGYSGDGVAAVSAELYYPFGVAVDSSGNIYIADYENERIRKVSTAGIITTVAGDGTPGYSGDGGAPTSAELALPSGVAVDSSGNIYIADYENQRIRKVSP